MSKQRRLIIFFVPPQKFIGGGILSIFSLCNTSREFEYIHKSEVLLCTYPGYPSYGKNDLFENDETIYSFDEVLGIGPIASLQLHVPEYAAQDILNSLDAYKETLNTIPKLSINILNQNILMMPEPQQLARWFTLTPYITQTTAHDKYSTQAIADRFGIPTHHLSTFADARQYNVRAYDKKDNIILLSPDKHPLREKVASKLSAKFKDYKIVTVQDMRYEDYKELVSRAKFVVTFGEGFDGYFIEAHFTGGVAFAVYNEDFFPDKSFSSFSNVYPDYDKLLSKLTKDIETLITNPKNYAKVSQQSLDAINKLYNYELYKENLRNFYEENYSFIPSEQAQKKLLGAVADANNKHEQEIVELQHRLNNEVAQLQKKVHDQHLKLQEQQIIARNEIALRNQQEKVLLGITNSLSWRITRPLRNINGLRKDS